MKAEHYTLINDGRVVTVLPNPLHDPRHTAAIKRVLRREDGWNHFTYGVNQISRNRAASDAVETAARCRLAEKACGKATEEHL